MTTVQNFPIQGFMAELMMADLKQAAIDVMPPGAIETDFTLLDDKGQPVQRGMLLKPKNGSPSVVFVAAVGPTPDAPEGRVYIRGTLGDGPMSDVFFYSLYTPSSLNCTIVPRTRDEDQATA